MKQILTIVIFLMTFCGCGDDDPSEVLILPSNLQFELQVDKSDPGSVVFTATADNVNFYSYYFGIPDEEATVSNDGKAAFKYTESGTYTVNVLAHATTSQYVSAEKKVTIKLEGDTTPSDIPSEGYTTPESYAGMNLVWQDEFGGTSISGDWTHEIGTGSNGWGNNELQYYKEENTEVRDGYLIITAKEESFGGRDYTSSRIITSGKQTFKYGRIDIRAALPQGQGIWPALWMLGSNFNSVGWPACGEIDIMELIGGSATGRDNTVHGTVHWDNAGRNANYGDHYTLSSGIFADEFHVFSIVWDATSITWYVDDVQFNVVDTTPTELSEFQNDFFFIFNVAVGGNWPGSPDANTIFPQKMIVDYVRVFQTQ
ncbi:glycoside hydrolase family 16 protein [Fulvivirga sp. 29W222]|uniref:Glycoside hydrolase family 16 protein n=1 Tax=Fulvivirga marina TaxID=2494733 RepID=A0A937KC12_9BACT|nr:glycoside hydrolase family 16 protein [Fulvivirga marina]MBL6444738.1 glycoside hydrolase family 16 protein [Fulvivirga marina]